MIEFGKDHSPAWLELMSAYQIFRARLFDWSREPDQVKQRDLLLELGSWENRDLNRRTLLSLIHISEYDLHCEAEFSQYADRYGTLIEQAYGLDEKGLADMKKTLSAGP